MLTRKISAGPVPQTYNPSYLVGWDWEDCGSKPEEPSSQNPISKITIAKWTGGVAQA
jgi:hypothetical protein